MDQYVELFILRFKCLSMLMSIIVMEFLGGGSGLDLLQSGPFDEASIAIICRELLYGLSYLHDNGKVCKSYTRVSCS